MTPSVEYAILAFAPCGCWAGSATRHAPQTVATLLNGAFGGDWSLTSMPVSDARAVVTRCPKHSGPRSTGAGRP